MTDIQVFRKIETGNNAYAQAPEINLPVSIYDIKISSANGTNPDIFSESRGKVTLLFNVAAGCGNIPQHSVLEELNQKYKDEKNFNIVAIVVDDFQCHGYEEFQDGIDKYIERNGLKMTPGEVAEDYAKKNFGVTYRFSELTNGRFDKHVYSSDYCPGTKKTQDQHMLWSYLTRAFEAQFDENGLPVSSEEVPWSKHKANPAPGVEIPYMPLTGNFTKFLIDKTGTKAKRYANGFLLGERNVFGETFPWFPEKYQEDGRRSHIPITEEDKENQELKDGYYGKWPTPVQRKGIEVSLDIISKDIETYLSE